MFANEGLSASYKDARTFELSAILLATLPLPFKLQDLGRFDPV